MKPIERIIEIQKEYVRLLDSHFKKERQEWKESGEPIEQFATKLFKSPNRLVVKKGGESLSEIEYKLLTLSEEIEIFWESREKELAQEIKKSDYLFLYTDNALFDVLQLVKTNALYFDTICAVDPFYRTGAETLSWSIHNQRDVLPVHFVDYISLLDAMEKLGFDAVPPVLVVVPSKTVYRPSALGRDLATKDLNDLPEFANSKARYYRHAKQLFQEFFRQEYEFQILNEIVEFIDSLSEHELRMVDAERLASLLPISGAQVKALVLVAGYDMDSARRGYVELQSLRDRSLPKGPVSKNALKLLYSIYQIKFVGTEMQLLGSNAWNMECSVSSGDWPLYLWKLRNDSRELSSSLNLSHDEVIHYTISNKMKWLSGLTMKQVLAIRKDDGLKEARQLLRVYKNRLVNASVDDIDEIASDMAHKVSERLSEYSENVAKTRRVGWWGVTKTGMQAVTSHTLGLAGFLLPLALDLIEASTGKDTGLISKSFKDVRRELTKGKTEAEKMRNSPIGILADAYADYRQSIP